MSSVQNVLLKGVKNVFIWPCLQRTSSSSGVPASHVSIGHSEPFLDGSNGLWAGCTRRRPGNWWGREEGAHQPAHQTATIEIFWSNNFQKFIRVLLRIDIRKLHIHTHNVFVCLIVFVSVSLFRFAVSISV